MRSITNLREGHEELNLPSDSCIDIPVYREAWRDLIKSKSTRDITYEQFLSRMKERNILSRKKEFERRQLKADWLIKDIEFISI